MKRKLLPGQGDGELFDNYVERLWVTDPELQEEFLGDFECYKAFCRADALGAVKILSKAKR